MVQRRPELIRTVPVRADPGLPVLGDDRVMTTRQRLSAALVNFGPPPFIVSLRRAALVGPLALVSFGCGEEKIDYSDCLSSAAAQSASTPTTCRVHVQREVFPTSWVVDHWPLALLLTAGVAFVVVIYVQQYRFERGQREPMTTSRKTKACAQWGPLEWIGWSTAIVGAVAVAGLGPASPVSIALIAAFLLASVASFVRIVRAIRRARPESNVQERNS